MQRVGVELQKLPAKERVLNMASEIIFTSIYVSLHLSNMLIFKFNNYFPLKTKCEEKESLTGKKIKMRILNKVYHIVKFNLAVLFI